MAQSDIVRNLFTLRLLLPISNLQGDLNQTTYESRGCDPEEGLDSSSSIVIGIDFSGNFGLPKRNSETYATKGLHHPLQAAH